MPEKEVTQKDLETNAANSELRSSLSFAKTHTDKFAVLITNTFGSITFLVCCLLLFTVWITWNLNLIPMLKPFDPFPFSTLEMSVSIFAIVLSVSVLINQNRQSHIEKIRQQVEFEINVRAEHEVTKILGMVHDMHQKMGLTIPDEKELEEMKAKTDLKEIQQTVDEKQKSATLLSSDLS